MADSEKSPSKTADGIYFAVPRRILEDELDWNLPDKKLSEQEVLVPELEQDVPSLRNNHSRLMDHFGPDVDEYLLRCSLDKFENHTVASFRKDVITQLSAAIESNSIKTSKKSLDSSSSEEDPFSEDPRKQKYSSIYKNNVSYSKQGRLFQKGSSACLPKTQGFFKADLDDEADFTRQSRKEGFFFTKSSLHSFQKPSLGSTLPDLKVTGNGDGSKGQKQEDRMCAKRGQRPRLQDNTFMADLHQMGDSNEADSAETQTEDSSHAREMFERDSRQKDDQASECFQESPKAKTRSRRSKKSLGNDLDSSSATDTIITGNENKETCSKTNSGLSQTQEDDLNSATLLGCPESENRGDGSLGSLCQRSDLSSLDKEEFGASNVFTAKSKSQRNLEDEIEQVVCINNQGDDFSPTTLQEDLKLKRTEVDGNNDSTLLSNVQRDEQCRDNDSDEIENKCKDVPLKGRQSKSTDVISRRGLREISAADLRSALEILKAKSSDILSKQNVFLHSMIDTPSSSAAESNSSQQNVTHAIGENQEKEEDECENKVEEEGGHESQVGHQEGSEKSKDEEDIEEEVRQNGSESQVRSEENENEDREEIWEEEERDEIDEHKVGTRKNGNEDVMMSEEEGDKSNDIEKRDEELRQDNDEAQETNEGSRDKDKEMNDKEMKQIGIEAQSTNERKRDAPESDILIAAQQVADSCQTQTSDSDRENDQTSEDIGGIWLDSYAPQLSDLPAVTLKGDHEGQYDRNDDIPEGATPKCLPRTAKILPKSSQSPPGQVPENYKFFREKSRFSVSDVILEEEEVDALAKTSSLSHRYRADTSEGAPTPSPRSIKCAEELSSDVLIISVSDEDSNETIKQVVNVKNPDAQRSPLRTSPLSCMGPSSMSPDPLDWAKFLSRDFLADPSQKDPGKVPEWDLSSAPESSASLWLSCSEDERQANLLNYDLFRTDFSDADPDLNSHWPFTDSQPTNCLNVFHSECYALHL